MEYIDDVSCLLIRCGCIGVVSLFGAYFMFFFFKQKTAYEMRISDWSSDVCSSDLLECDPPALTKKSKRVLDLPTMGSPILRASKANQGVPDDVESHRACPVDASRRSRSASACFNHRRPNAKELRRSDEHKSEIQSLMRHSYDDFSFKKKIILRT